MKEQVDSIEELEKQIKQKEEELQKIKKLLREVEAVDWVRHRRLDQHWTAMLFSGHPIWIELMFTSLDKRKRGEPRLEISDAF